VRRSNHQGRASASAEFTPGLIADNLAAALRFQFPATEAAWIRYLTRRHKRRTPPPSGFGISTRGTGFGS
jgi:hypothetical protein